MTSRPTIKEDTCRLELEESRDGSARFMLAGVVDFDTVMSLNQMAQAQFPHYKQITVDLSGITYVNSAGLALLLEWQRQALLDKRSIKILGTPRKLLNIARVSEIEDILPLDI